MAGEVSFDVVSEFDRQELVNALDQVRREIATRFDFRQAHVELELGKDEITLVADDEFRARAVKDLIETKAIRRNLSLKIFDWGKVEPAGGSRVRQTIGLRRGLPEELAKKISKLIRDDYPRVKSHPGRRRARQRQEQGRPAESDRPAARGGGGVPRAAPVPELPMKPRGRMVQVLMVIVVVAIFISFIFGALSVPR